MDSMKILHLKLWRGQNFKMAANKNAKWQFHLTSLFGHLKVLGANQIAYSRPELHLQQPIRLLKAAPSWLTMGGYILDVWAITQNIDKDMAQGQEYTFLR